ncbi:TonB-dependent receptor plug domain-containing protein [Parabacteroides sp. OttesenSCG-928-G06]|nr:TonB-dependent receptor plug domain-containing protein [Parabacteroides sp. OttesenSCG-928-G06]
MNRSLCIVFVFVLCAFPVMYAQEIKINAADESLDKVLQNLGVEISFDSKAVSIYRITETKVFETVDDAMVYLLKDKPLMYKKTGNVYVIYPEETQKQPSSPPKEYILSGVISDDTNGEKLAYSYIQTDNGTIITDEKGFFSLKSHESSTRIRTYYLGYNNIDTILSAGHHALQATPRLMMIPEITVSPSSSAMMMQSGKTSGEMRLNHTVAGQMPGSGDNSVFNLLRMMPGVRASGESSDDLIVWGSNNGESKITFDGFTLFGLKSFSDHISFINPYMVKDIRLLKGGYDASIGNRIGGVAEIIGIGGNRDKPTVKATVSNLTANLFASVPVSKRSVLMASYRQTFYNLYDVEQLNPYGKNSSDEGNGKGKGDGKGNGNGQGNNKPQQDTNEVYLSPDYKFHDINIKYAGNTSGNDSYQISLYTSNDDFDYSVAKEDKYDLSASQNGHQYAGSGMYNKVWNNTSSSRFLMSYSRLDTQNDHVTKLQGNQSEPAITISTKNRIEEMRIDLNHTFHWGTHQKIKLGGEVLLYKDRVDEDKSSLTVPSIYLSDNFAWGKFSLDGSVRADLANNKLYIQPRFSGRYTLSEAITATASWGMYRQYISRTPIQTDNYTDFVWKIHPDSIMSSMHTLAGLAFSKNGFLLSMEGYYKKNKNIMRLSNEPYKTNVDIAGMDLFLKKEFNQASLFGSYSLCHISDRKEETGHEVKLGGIFAIRKFTLSANYVWGTGFSPAFKGGQGIMQGNNTIQESDTDYHRLDVGLRYNHQFRSFRLQAGASILNVLNNENMKYSYLFSDRKEVTNIYTKATPFTPMIFIEILF